MLSVDKLHITETEKILTIHLDCQIYENHLNVRIEFDKIGVVKNIKHNTIWHNVTLQVDDEKPSMLFTYINHASFENIEMCANENFITHFVRQCVNEIACHIMLFSEIQKELTNAHIFKGYSL